MMKNLLPQILIIGYGFVGAATHSVLPSNSFDVIIFDPLRGHDLPEVFDVHKLSAIFLCLPTPANKDGSCDDALVTGFVDANRHVTCPLIVRSTIPPSTIDKLLKLKQDIVYFPEFLREKTWETDVKWPEFTVVGCNNLEIARKVFTLIKSSEINIRELLECTPIEASLFKYVHNTFLAMKVVYFHELYQWMTSAGYENNWAPLLDLLQYDKRLGHSHMEAPGHHGLGFSGSCFPKDTTAFTHETGGMLTLLMAAVDANKRLRNEHTETIQTKTI